MGRVQGRLVESIEAAKRSLDLRTACKLATLRLRQTVQDRGQIARIRGLDSQLAAELVERNIPPPLVPA